MTDIVERLRTFPNGTDLDREAADAIDLLRAAVKKAIGFLEGEGLYSQAASLNRDLSVTADEEQG